MNEFYLFGIVSNIQLKNKVGWAVEHVVSNFLMHRQYFRW